MHVADRIARRPDVADPRSPELRLNFDYLEKNDRADHWNKWREVCARSVCAGERRVKDRVLFVDDEPNVLDGIRRQLRNRVDLGDREQRCGRLELIRIAGPFAVVSPTCACRRWTARASSRACNEIAPESVRMVLTGQADLDSTIKAVNEGRIFRFLLKPCDADTLLDSAQERASSNTG